MIVYIYNCGLNLHCSCRSEFMCVVFFCVKKKQKRKRPNEMERERERHKVVHTHTHTNTIKCEMYGCHFDSFMGDLYYHGINEPISGIQALLKYERCFYSTSPHCTLCHFLRTHTHVPHT